jgi:hypothetical protein
MAFFCCFLSNANFSGPLKTTLYVVFQPLISIYFW